MTELLYAKNVPVLGSFDVVVAGGGPAGICAAVASARQGAATALVESDGVLGGNLTAGHVAPIMGTVSDGTLSDEVLRMLRVRTNDVAHDIEHAKKEFINWITDAGVSVFLQTKVVDALMDGNVIKGVVVGTHEGIGVILANVVIDATGNGTVSCLAGADFDKGRDSDGLMQPVSLMFTIAGVNESKAITCYCEEDEATIPGGKFTDVCKLACNEGKLPENVSIVRLYRTVRGGERIVNAAQQNYIDGTVIQDIAKAELSLRNQIAEILEFLRETVPGYEECYIRDSSDTLGIRETRRIKGEYTLSDHDLIEGRRFDDVMVHKANFVIDIHNPSGGGQAEGYAAKAKPYDIPYRCFVPLKVDNLLTAGRCISGTHRAHASYRVMNICMAMGQAVGIAAVISAKERVYPRELDYKTIQRVLIDLGVDLFS